MTAEQKRIKELMQLLQCTEDEAKDIIETDRIIDQDTGQKVQLSFDLSEEQQKTAKKYTVTTERKGKKGNNRGKMRAEDTQKTTIIAILSDFLAKNEQISAKNVEILNKSRQIRFEYGDQTYDLTLIKKTKKAD